jgi:hypothetical protein
MPPNNSSNNNNSNSFFRKWVPTPPPGPISSSPRRGAVSLDSPREYGSLKPTMNDKEKLLQYKTH